MRHAWPLLALLLIAAFGFGPRVAGADNATPSPVVSTPEVTIVPSVTVIAETPVVVAREKSTPVVKSETAPVATEAPAPTEGPTATPAPSATPTVVVAQPSGLAGIYVPLPSPAELEMNARLRWGRRVPASVRRWAFLIVPAARRYHISANLIAAVMTMESNGDPLAWNASSDARGLMQILHGPWDPRANIFTGARMLARFLSEFHDLTLALAAYNAGPNAVIAAGGVPSFRETRDYVIVVRYLFDLYGNHPLTSFRRNLYRSTLRDLERFADARKKVRILARLAHISDSLTLTCRHLGSDCSSSGDQLLFQTGDPFWPIDDQPDPLSHTVPALP